MQSCSQDRRGQSPSSCSEGFGGLARYLHMYLHSPGSSCPCDCQLCKTCRPRQRCHLLADGAMCSMLRSSDAHHQRAVCLPAPARAAGARLKVRAGLGREDDVGRLVEKGCAPPRLLAAAVSAKRAPSGTRQPVLMPLSRVARMRSIEPCATCRPSMASSHHRRRAAAQAQAKGT